MTQSKTVIANFCRAISGQRVSAAAFALLFLSACNLYTGEVMREGIGFREARFAEISAMRDYRACRDDAVELDHKARAEGSVARYLASAKLIEKCEADLGSDVAKVAEEERMRAYALNVQNYFKGGDVAKARVNLEKFTESFPENDLYLADGSSFVETMQVLLGVQGRSSLGQFSVANVNDDVKAELRRVRYWKKN